MTRLMSTVRWDVTLQFRYGFYYVSGFIVLVWAVLLSQIPADSRFDLILPAFLAMNLLITTFYFMGALVLLEKGEGTLSGLVVSPLREGEYLLSKVASLSALAIMESLAVILFVYGMDFNWLFVIIGMTALAGFYVLVGFIAIARYDTLNDYLMPSMLFVTVLMLPMLDHFGMVSSPIFYLHPVNPMLALIRAGFVESSTWEIAYGVIGSMLCVSVSFVIARRVFYRFIVRSAGT